MVNRKNKRNNNRKTKQNNNQRRYNRDGGNGQGPSRQASRENSSSGSSIGKALVSAGAGLADTFMPGTGGIVRGIGKILGLGAYTRSGAQTWLASNVPQMHATLDRGVRICHHEYLGEMTSSTAFLLFSYAINPGLGKTFPWLSSLAAAFQKWEDHGIVFYFKSTSASALNSTNTALGSAMGAVTYNPYQLAPTDKVTMLGLSGVQTGKPAEDNLFPVECKLSQNLFATKLIRTGNVTDDLAKYDAGKFHLATVGSQAIATIGELHVVYDITLKEPRLGATGWSANYNMKYHVDAMGIVDALGTNPTVTKDSIGLTVVNTTVGAVSFFTVTFPVEALTPMTTYDVSVTYGMPVLTGVPAAGITYPQLVSSNVTTPHAFPPDGMAYSACPAGEPGNVAQVSNCTWRTIIRPTDSRLPIIMSFSGNGAALPNVGAAGTFDMFLRVDEIDSLLT